MDKMLGKFAMMTLAEMRALCDREFGPHDHDDANCGMMLDQMGVFDGIEDEDDFDYTSYDYPEYDAQTAHFERFGCPAFPNEY